MGTIRTTGEHTFLNKKNGPMMESFLACIKLGMSTKSACDCVGIHVQTVYGYLGQAKRDFEDKKSTIYTDFYKKYRQAKSRFIQSNIKNICKAGDEGDWKASAWLLERRASEDFGAKQDVNVGVEKINIVCDLPKKEEED